jgi:hypothetical protein
MSFLHSDMSLTSDDPSDLFSPCFNRTENYLAGDSSPGTTSNDANLQGRQLNPVMKGPRIMDARKNSGALQHQRSAKALISRYESMSSSRSIRPPPRLLGPPKKTRSSSPINKDKSPIRQSFRNLFGVFRKGNALAKDKTSRSTGIPPIIGSRKSNLLPSQLASPNPVVLPQAGIGKVDDSQPSAKPYSGTLLYLSRVSSSSLILPVWTVCTASLQKDHILVKWITAHGNPSYHSISLADCGDVRSLALSQISPDERALLPSKGDPEDLRVFEILFEGRPREKFAATSAHERAGWVSAIW